MKIKSFIIIIYTLAGLLISVSTAFMTFIIIGEPIGTKMFLQIVFSIILVLPIIGLISYYLGKYLSKKFSFIQDRLESIKREDFSQDESVNIIYEINEINQNINFLSHQLNNLISNLKEKNQNLSNLLISMAHDIKTPITILNGYVEEIQDDMISKEELPMTLSHMKNEIIFLDELTVDMLEFITSMQNHKSKENINLRLFIEKEIFTILPKNRNIKYINDVNDSYFIDFNTTDLKKVCLNILTNALKHTNSGHIKIDIQENNILFENTGQEIKSEYSKEIFKPFFTVDKSKNRKKSGFGLGLSIVENLAKNNSYSCYLKLSNENKTIFCLQKESLK
ncbi:MAG TPA: HAMP domain-containing histidine kinase [Sulfurovum sp.]|nr:HAMP domain-containing histidine kinase [Sulfurovum sp.]